MLPPGEMGAEVSLSGLDGRRIRLVGSGKLREGLWRLCVLLRPLEGGAGSAGTAIGTLCVRKWPGVARGR